MNIAFGEHCPVNHFCPGWTNYIEWALFVDRLRTVNIV